MYLSFRRRFVVIVLSCAGSLYLSACGGGGGGSVAPAPVPDPPPVPQAPVVSTQAVFSNLTFSQPVSMVQAPGDPNRWFVVEQRGVVRGFDNDPDAQTSFVFVDISTRVTSGGEAGLLGIAFHPSFPGTPEVYLSYTAPGSPLVSTVSRFTSSDNGQTLDPGSEQIVLTLIQPQSNHNGGDLVFGQDGYLYASFGDGGGSGDPSANAQNVANLLGTIVRIDINGNSPYEIPADNPFANTGLCIQGTSSGTPCPEIFAWGLRNPWRMSIDTAVGSLWIGDVGQGAWEEINRIELDGLYDDANYGWNNREGANCYPPGSSCAIDSLDPVAQYERALGQSVTGGYVYRGSGVPDLEGWYVFGDFVQGAVFAVLADSDPTVEPVVLLSTPFQISTFAQDVDGELYVIDYGAGTVHQIVAAP